LSNIHLNDKSVKQTLYKELYIKRVIR
jgi:hypothetical protein